MVTPSTLRDESALASQAGAANGFHLLVMGPQQFATFALPARGEVTVGRGDGAGVHVNLDDAKASRRHLRLHVGDDVEVEDLGSANGTRVREQRIEPGTRVRVLPGEAITIGSLVLMVQPNRPARAARPGQPLPHAEFVGRVQWECARAEATGGKFSVARVDGPPGAADDGVILRPNDVIGSYGPGQYELLLPGLARVAALSLATAFAERLAGGAGALGGIGVVTFPDDGVHAGALVSRAAEAARQNGPAPAPERRTRDSSASVICVEESMRRVQSLADRAAAGDINVLILGETGVGKEVLARAIHAASARASRPFVPIDCAAVARSLLATELFGHERGAFTGAAQAKTGLIEMAPGGTVFLDEIGELPHSEQAMLLRVIETREVFRVGGVRPRKVDVRFIAATNRDLEAEVSLDAFRRDLFFRLNGMTLTIPPLRERPRDLPILAHAFIAQLARGRVLEISDEAMDVLRAHGWPGNVRELRNVIERALLLCDGPTLLPEHLPTPVPVAPEPAAPEAVAALPPGPAPSAADERTRILAALAACAGNQSRAARQLGISRKVLIARLDSYGVARPRKPGAS